ncbi:hypothetical protein JHK86_018964 [Glycine max]|nr:hypothetical protein JHK86_018964 [Glycine max]
MFISLVEVKRSGTTNVGSFPTKRPREEPTTLTCCSANIDVWAFMDPAITVASVDHADEMTHKRDGIGERLYTTSSSLLQCRNCNAGDDREIRTQSSPSMKEENDLYKGLFDDEQRKILDIKEQLEDPHQPKDLLVELLPNLVNMNITI